MIHCMHTCTHVRMQVMGAHGSPSVHPVDAAYGVVAMRIVLKALAAGSDWIELSWLGLQVAPYAVRVRLHTHTETCL